MMTKEEMQDLYGRGRKPIGKHEQLFALCIESWIESWDDSSEADWDEAVFTVPCEWLKDLLKLNYSIEGGYPDTLDANGEITVRTVREWLRNEYNSEDSEWIFEEAASQKQLVTFQIN